ncbi:hypothetical protein APL35_gp147 [Apis mellifera filamentous virus]|uniref:hypothetical protein n=1 Tax=Apis mellifera filamentous virus TaxID=1100043 RepID=UPI0006BD2112|nr:hypothetical protein APL35_gp147 [Apis mellifera filamentous virus]
MIVVNYLISCILYIYSNFIQTFKLSVNTTFHIKCVSSFLLVPTQTTPGKTTPGKLYNCFVKQPLP